MQVANQKNQFLFIKSLKTFAITIALFLTLLQSFRTVKTIKNFVPLYEPRLRSYPGGIELLQNIDQFLNSSIRNKNLLDKIMTSGYIYGHPDHEQIFGILEFLFRTQTEFVKGFHPVGQTFMKEEIMAVRIGKRRNPSTQFFNSVYSFQNKNKPTKFEPSISQKKSVIFLNGLHHSRELISGTFMIKMVLEAIHNLKFNSQKELTFWEFCDIIMIPIVNLDGFKFITDSQRLTDDFLTPISNPINDNPNFNFPEYPQGKFKRKNMNTNYCKESKDGVDIGVDLNRNYGYKWGQSDGEEEKRSLNECEEVYRGPKPFSEPETQTVRDLVLREQEFIVLALSFHSWGDHWLEPFFFEKQKHIEDFPLEEHIIDFYVGMRQNILNTSPMVKVGTVIDLIGYASNGETSDWILGELGIMAYTAELGFPDEEFKYTFFTPKNLINPQLDENFKVIQILAEKSRFQITSETTYLNSQNEFVISFENKTLGKAFNPKIRIQISDSEFIKAIDSMKFQQNSQIEQSLDIEIFNKESELIGTLFANKQNSSAINLESLGSESYIEITPMYLDRLSKFNFLFKLNENIESLGKIDFVLSVIFEDLYELNHFEFSQKFSETGYWKIGFIGVISLNFLLVTMFFISNLSFLKNKSSNAEKEKMSADLSQKDPNQQIGN